MNEELLNKLKNKELLNKVINAKTEEEVLEIFSENGIQVSKEDIEMLGKFLGDIKQKLTKLSDNDFNNISGGAFTGGVLIPFEKECDLLMRAGLPNIAAASASLTTFIASCICVWEGGKWVIKKGKEKQWFDKFNNSFNSVKSKLVKK